jgi:hypothetical protein
MNKIILILAFIIFNLHSKGQIVDSSIYTSDSSNVITDVFYTPPYYIDYKNFNNSIFIPSCELINDFYRGHISIHLYIDDKSNILGFNIFQIDMWNDNNINIFHYSNLNRSILSKGEYPKDIMKYYKYIEPIVRDINLLKEKEIKPDTLNVLQIGLKIKEKTM